MKKISITLLCFLLLGCASIKIRKQVAIDYFNLGNSYLDLKEYQKAIEIYEKALEYNNKSPEIILNLIIAYQQNKDYDKVEKTILKYYKNIKYEYSKKLLMLLGNNFFLQEKYEQAINIYNEYLGSYPDDADCYFNLGLTYMKLLDEKKALFYFTESYKKNNKLVPAIYNLAVYYYNKKDYDNSIFYYNKLIELDTGNPDAFYKIGHLEFEINEYDKAREHLLKAIDLDKKNSNYDLLLARIYAKGYKNKDKTLHYLELAFKNKFKDLKTLRSFDEFKLLFDYDEFKKLLKQYDIQ